MSLLVMRQGTKQRAQSSGFGGQESSNNFRKQGGRIKRCTGGRHIPCEPPDSVTDPRLILQATARPERFLLDAGILAGLSSLTLSIIDRANSGSIGDWLSVV